MLCAVLLAPPGRAATYVVPSGYSTIQAGIDAAVSGDTVLLEPGTYSGAGNHTLDFHGKNIVLRSQAGFGATVIDALATRDDRRRLFRFHSGEDSTARIEGITIQGGWAPADGPFGESRGGGLYFDSSVSPQIIRCVIRDNAAATGGGGVACLTYARPVFRDCEIVGNVCLYSAPAPTGGWGGGVGCFSEAAPKFFNCRFADNRGNLGGAVAALHGHPMLDSCRVEYNTAEAFVSLTPPAGGHGGGMLVDQGSLRIRASVFFGNVARAHVVAPARGGAIAGFFSFLDASHSTFSENSAETRGDVQSTGACMYFSFCTTNLSYCILSFNRDVEVIHCIDAISEPQLVCCDVYGNEGGDYVDCIEGQQGAADNFSMAPLYCDRYAGDVSLRVLSPCLPGNAPCGETVGALGLGCVQTPVDGEPDTTPERVELSPCAPNPFNAATSITLTLDDSMHGRPIDVRVLDILGRHVRSLFTGVGKPGNQRFVWDGTDDQGGTSASGLYLIAVTAADRRVVRKALLIR